MKRGIKSMSKTVKKIVMICIFAFICIAFDKKVFATSISFSNNNPKVGESVRVTVSVPNVNTASVYANVTGPGINTQVKVVGGDLSGGKQTYSNSVTVTPNAVGKITVVVTGNSSAVADGAYVNVGASVTANVTAPVAPSPSVNPSPSTNPNPGGNTGNNNGGNTVAKDTNANLGRFRIYPAEYDTFKLNANTLEYRVNVPNEVTSIRVEAVAASGKAKSVSGNGTHNLKEGSNRIDVTVIAEAGNKKTYTLWVTRAYGSEGEVPPNVIDEPVEEPNTVNGLVNFEIPGIELDKEFKTDIYEYLVKTEEEITKEWLEEIKGKLVYTASNESFTAEAVTEVLENGKKGTITIVVKDAENEYAKYVITFEREEKEEKPVAALVTDSNSGNTTGIFGLSFERMIYAILGIYGITLIVAIFFAVNCYLKDKRLAEYEDDQEFEEDTEFEKMNEFYMGVTGKQEENKDENVDTENSEENEEKNIEEFAKEENAEDTVQEVASSLRRLGGYRNLRNTNKSSGRHF